MKSTLYCANCRAHAEIEHEDYNGKYEAGRKIRWTHSSDHESLCPKCSLIGTLMTYPNGEYNNTVTAMATEEGIEIECIGTLYWDWIDSARGVMNERALDKLTQSYVIYRKDGRILFFCKYGFQFASEEEQRVMRENLKGAEVIEVFDSFFMAKDAFDKINVGKGLIEAPATVAARCDHVIGYSSGSFGGDDVWRVSNVKEREETNRLNPKMLIRDFGETFVFCPLCGERNA